MRLGLPPRPIDENEVKIDFMPCLERVIDRDGVVFDYIHYYDPVLQPYMEDVDRATLPR